MTGSGPTLLFAGIDLALFALAVRRPWVGLAVLLAGLPFNGILLDVVARSIGGVGLGRIALAGWHDALSLGIVIAAALAVRRPSRWHLRSIESLAVVVLVFGLVGVLRTPDLVSALYSYRTIYLPVAVMAAIVMLARQRDFPHVAATRAAGGMVGAGLVASVFAWWQVYVGGFTYLNMYFRIPGEALPAAYSATFVTQPRAIGTFHSPNEFGGFLVLALVLALTPGILPLGRFRAWVGVVLGLALVLSFSRSAWVGAIAAAVVVPLMIGWRPGGPNLARLRDVARRHLASVGTFAAMTLVIAATSGGFLFVDASVRGNEPSAQTHIGAVTDVITGLIDGAPEETAKPGDPPKPPRTVGSRAATILLGDGLGTAGPKSTRFSGDEPTRHSEIWYLNFIWQVGMVGLLLAGILVVVMLITFFSARPRPWAAAAAAALLALGAGGLFIPVLDEPAVALSLWAILGLAIASTLKAEGEPVAPAVAVAAGARARGIGGSGLRARRRLC